MSEEYKRLQQALAQATTPEGRRAAAQAMQDYLATHGGNATLASSGTNESYPNVVSLGSMPDQIANNPKFAKLMDRVVNHK
jgi:hypothetical protein